MKSLLLSKRSKAIVGIGVLAIGIGAISKKVISYPTGGCMKGGQEMTLNWHQSILNNPWISWNLENRICILYQEITLNKVHK